jgi:hypothetical protein
MAQFTVPSNGTWTWHEDVSVTPPGASEPQTLGVTFRTVADFAGLVRQNVAGEVSDVGLIRAILVDWSAAYEDGADIPLDSDDAAALIGQRWITTPIFVAYGASAGGQPAKNGPTSGAPLPAPTTAASSAPKTAKGSRKT